MTGSNGQVWRVGLVGLVGRLKRLLSPLGRPAVACLVLFVLGVVAAPAVAGERYALVVTGASGDATFAQRYESYRARLTSVFADRLAFGREHVVALGEKQATGVQVATRENVRTALAALAARMHKADLLMVVLVGHGTFDGNIAKFNLVGPDLDAAEWASLIKQVPGKVIVVNTASSSFPFLAALSAKNRVVITATDSAEMRYDTVFAEYFIKALETAPIGSGGDERLSIWDVFTSTTAGVRRYYEEKGTLPVEHALLDDAGDGFGKDAEQPGVDASIAQAVYLTPDPADQATDDATRELVARRDDLLGQLEKLKAGKASMEEAAYQSQLEQVLVEIAKISHTLRTRGKTFP